MFFILLSLLLLPTAGSWAFETGKGWAPVASAIDRLVADGTVKNGLAVQIYTHGGLQFSHGAGRFQTDTVGNVASSSKGATALTLLRLADQGMLRLDDPVSKYLKDSAGKAWGGERGKITVRQLLSMRSGLAGPGGKAETDCEARPMISRAGCVATIYDAFAQPFTPGEVFTYGRTDWTLAAAVAEAAAGKPWDRIFDEQIRIPFGWSEDSVYTKRAPNANAGGGLSASVEEYARLLEMIFHEGVYRGKRLLSAAMVRELRTSQWDAATKINFSPARDRQEYGLGFWIECRPHAANAPCPSQPAISSPGLWGFYPFIDWENRYYGVIGMREQRAGADGIGQAALLRLRRQIRDEVEKALRASASSAE